jgi:hypothetical protein
LKSLSAKRAGVEDASVMGSPHHLCRVRDGMVATRLAVRTPSYHTLHEPTTENTAVDLRTRGTVFQQTT